MVLKSRSFRIDQTLIGDVHVMKNSEWGAVAYLTQAVGSLPAKNTNTSWYTGGASSAATVWSTNVNQSTTGNLYGIYDMNGGAWDAVAGYTSNVVSAAYRTEILNASSGFKNIVGTGYQTNSLLWTTKGMAIEETSTAGTGLNSWSGAVSVYPSDPSDAPFFRRGNAQDQSSGAGIYGFFPASGNATTDTGFRPVMILR